MNGWIDYSNYALKPMINSKTGQSIIFDDYDTLYEWVAEEICEVEEALPEQEGDNDDTGKINPNSVALENNRIEFTITQILPSVSYKALRQTDQLSKGHFLQWTPPPNT